MALFQELRKRYEFRVEVKKTEAREEYEELVQGQKDAYSRLFNSEMQHMKETN